MNYTKLGSRLKSVSHESAAVVGSTPLPEILSVVSCRLSRTKRNSYARCGKNPQHAAPALPKAPLTAAKVRPATMPRGSNCSWRASQKFSARIHSLRSLVGLASWSLVGKRERRHGRANFAEHGRRSTEVASCRAASAGLPGFKIVEHTPDAIHLAALHDLQRSRAIKSRIRLL